MSHSSSDQTVISLSDFREQSRQGPVAEVQAYWDGLRNGRIMPARSDIDPRGISGALEHAFVLERVARGIGRFRLAGMHLNDIMGMEVRGMPLTALILPESREEMSASLAAVFDEPAAVRLSLTSDTGLGRPHMEARMLLLPLRSDLGDVSRILGCFVADGMVGRSPRRFSITGQNRRTLIGHGEPIAAAMSPTTAPVERDRDGNRRPGSHRHPRHPDLRLVDTDE